jgi:transglutaminase-like putative cysteine protease
MRSLKLLGGLLIFSAFGMAWGQTDIRLDEAFACDAKGAPAPVRLGEPFWVGARFRVAGSPNSTFRFRVETPYSKLDTPRLSFGTKPGEYFVYWGPVPTIMDGPVSVIATLDPEKKVRESNRLNNAATFQVAPVPPGTALEAFAPRTLEGKLGIEVQWNRRSAIPSQVAIWMPRPESDSFQTLGALAAPAGFAELLSEPHDRAVLVSAWSPVSLETIRREISFTAESSAVRTNFALLSRAGNRSEPAMAPWLQPEAFVELHRPEFASWVNAEVPAFSRAGLSAAEMARDLYRSILRRCAYEYRPNASPSAYQALRSRKGYCGALSSLFVALCRTVGIPARTVSGFYAGRSGWHVWAEFHVRGTGWVPVDPAFAEARLPKGSDLPIYFGVLPEGNERVATAFGLDRRLGERFMPMLQSPAVFWTGSGIKVQRISTYSELAAR